MGQKLTTSPEGRNWPMAFHEVKLFDKIRAGDIAAVCDFLRQNPQHVMHYYYGKSLLHHFAEYDRPELLEALLDCGLSVNVEEEHYPWGALMAAVIRDKLKSIKFLLSRGAATNYKHRGKLFSCGIESQVAGNTFDRDQPKSICLEIVKAVVEHGLPLDVLYGEGCSLLSLAIGSGQTEIAAYLRSKGALEEHEIPARTAKQAAPREKWLRTADLVEDVPVVDYFAESVGPVDPDTLLEVVPSDPAIAIHVCRDRDGSALTLFTTGMAHRAMTVHVPQLAAYRFAELFMKLPVDWPLRKLDDPRVFWPIQFLRTLAKKPHHSEMWLGPLMVIPNGDPPEPLGPGVPYDSVIISSTHRVRRPDGESVALYRVIPLHPEERELEAVLGFEAFLEICDQPDSAMMLEPMRPYESPA